MKKLSNICVMILGFSSLLLAQSPLPYYNNFETDTLGWYSDTSAGDSFHWDSTNYVSCTGTRGLGIGLDTTGTFTTLYSPWFDFSSVLTASLCLTHKYDATLNQDGIRLEYTTDGFVWNILGNTMQGANWYNAPVIMSSALPAWSGTLTNCINSSISVSSLSGHSMVQFRFVPTMDVTLEYFLDDFRICISPCFCDSIVGSEEFESERGYLVYPNPAINSFTIENKYFNNSEYSIYTSTGKEIFSGEMIANRSVHSGYFSPGVYFIKILDSRKSVVMKVVITGK